MDCLGEHVKPCDRCIRGSTIGMVNFGVGQMRCSKCSGTGVLVDWWQAEEVTASDPDYDSVMAYAVPNSWTIGDYEVATNDELSAGDIAWLRKMYPDFKLENWKRRASKIEARIDTRLAANAEDERVLGWLRRKIREAS